MVVPVLTAGCKLYYKPVTTTVAKANNTGAAVTYVFTRINIYDIIGIYNLQYNGINIIAVLRTTGVIFPKKKTSVKAATFIRLMKNNKNMCIKNKRCG